MSQLNFYVSEQVEKKIRQDAKSCGKSISSYLADLVKSHVEKDQWQKDFFKKICGGWQGAFPKISNLPMRRVEEF